MLELKLLKLTKCVFHLFCWKSFIFVATIKMLLMLLL